jgi:peptidoglycan hydrolase CwlO-like protein
MTESELIKRITDMRDENRRYEKEIADLERIVERLDAEKNELKDIKADLEDENRHLSERVKLLEHKRDELLDELKRVGGDKERDIVVGQLMAYRQMFRMILDRGKE